MCCGRGVDVKWDLKKRYRENTYNDDAAHGYQVPENIFLSRKLGV